MGLRNSYGRASPCGTTLEDFTMKPTRHMPAAEGLCEGVQIIRKQKTADQLIISRQVVRREFIVTGHCAGL